MDLFRPYQIILVLCLLSLETQSICNSLIANQSSLQDSVTIASLIQKAQSCRQPNCDSSIVYLKQALIHSKKARDNRRIVDCYNDLGAEYRRMGDTGSSQDYLNRALKLSDSIKYEGGLGTAYLRLGSIFKRLDSLEQARKFFLKSIETFSKIDRPDRLGSAYNNIALLEKSRGNLEESMEYFVRSANYGQISGNMKMLMKIYNNIANIFSNIEDYANAFKYYQKAVKIADRIDLPVAKAGLEYNLAKCHFNKNNDDSALYYFNKIIISGIYVKQHHSSTVNSYLSKIFYRKQDSVNALRFANRAIQRSQKDHDLSIAYEEKARLLVDYGNLDNAKVYFNKSFRLIQELQFQSNPTSSIRRSYLFMELGHIDSTISILNRVLDHQVLDDTTRKRCYILLSNAYQKLGDIEVSKYYLNLHRAVGAKIRQNQKVLAVSIKNLEECCLNERINTAQIVSPNNNNYQLIIAGIVLIIVIVSVSLNTRHTDSVKFPIPIKVMSEDDEFLRQAYRILEKDGSDSKFDVRLFVREIGISRSHLHRKVKNLTGLSASEFIRDYRLNVAYNMLKNGRKNIAQVAYDSGFNSPSYFTECFKRKYGKLPSEIRRPSLSKSAYKHLSFSSILVNLFK